MEREGEYPDSARSSCPDFILWSFHALASLMLSSVVLADNRE